MNRLLFYLPRALSVAILLYVALFISSGPMPPFVTPNSTAHYIIIFIVVGISAAAWMIPMMGGIILMLFGIKYLLMISQPGNLNQSIMILGLFVITGVLFMWEGYQKNK